MSFVELYFNGALKNVHEIDQGAATIGRASHNHIQIDNKGVSSTHASIVLIGKDWFVEDLNSTNGTFVNGVKISGKQKIDYGDTIGICKYDLILTMTRTYSSCQQVPLQDDGFDKTLMVNKAPDQKSDLDKKVNTAFFLVNGEVKGIQKLIFKKDTYTIGGAKDSDLRVGGWFTPKLIAEIAKLGESYYLLPIKKRYIKINNKDALDRVKLINDDNIKIKSLSLKFVRE